MTLKQTVLALAGLCTNIADGKVSRQDLKPLIDPIRDELHDFLAGFVDTPEEREQIAQIGAALYLLGSALGD